jgi:hypothetical protein
MNGAITTFQRKRRLRVTGRLDARLTDRLLEAAFVA